MKRKDILRSVGAPRPREFLRSAEDEAVKIRKLLAVRAGKRGPSWSSRSAANAIALTNCIEILTRHGRSCNAAEARVIVVKVERLIDALDDEIRFLLMDRKQRLMGE